ncbi:hypothetical protein ACFQ51_35225 [Streptomyces kaempferi]
MGAVATACRAYARTRFGAVGASEAAEGPGPRTDPYRGRRVAPPA